MLQSRPQDTPSPPPEITVQRKTFVEPTLQEEFSLVAGTLLVPPQCLGSGGQCA